MGTAFLHSIAATNIKAPGFATRRLRVYWVAVKELKLRDYPPIMENQMEKKIENEMEAGGI